VRTLFRSGRSLHASVIRIADLTGRLASCCAPLALLPRQREIGMRFSWLAVLSCVVMSGCITPLNVGPVARNATALSSGKGMVFAEVHIVGQFTDGMMAMYGGHNKGSISDDTYSAELPPGEYTLDSFTRPSGGYSGGFGGVTVTTTEYTSWPVRRTFTIRAGQITNLGEIVVVPQTIGSPSGEFNYVFIDNSADAAALFRARFPLLAGSMQPGAMQLAPGNYLSVDQLQRLRTYIASQLAHRAPHLRYIAGPAGTLAVVEHDKRRNAAVLKLLDAGTVSGLTAGGEDRAHDRFSYSTTDGRVFVMRGGRPQLRSRPQGVDFHYPVYLAGDHLAVLATSSFEIYTSSDDASSWTRVVDRKEKADQPWYHGDFGFVHDDTTMLVFERSPARVMAATVAGGRFENFPIPAEVKDIREITLLESGIYLQPRVFAWTEKTPNPFYVRARSGGEWQVRHLPLGTCGPISFQDESGTKLRTACGQASYASADGGEHWNVLSSG
jgi:hypothetical protein